MQRGRKAVGSPEHLEAIRTARRLRELVPQVGPTAAAEEVGVAKSYASMVANGKTGKGLLALTIDSLGLRRSSKLCRRCSEKAVIVTKSHLCIVCELLELAKEQLITIEAEEA